MPCCLTILGSGSSGNCAYIETEATRLLIDAGISAKQIEERMASIGKSPSQLHGILITHEHNDHIQGLRVLATRYRIPVYANSQTRLAIIENFEATSSHNSINWKIFETGQRFPVGDFDAEPFSIPHDACEPVGFLLHHADRCVGFFTDLGHATQLVLDKARRVHILILETNYDERLLQDDHNRPWSVKQRISGRHGHLSNEAAAKLLGEIINKELLHVYLAHLSQECNQPKLAEAVILKKLAQIGATHVKVTVTHPLVPCPTETLLPNRALQTETLSLFGQLNTTVGGSPGVA